MNYLALRDDVITPSIRKYGKVIALRRPGSTAGWTKAWVNSRYQWTYAGPPNPPANGTVVYIDPAGTPVDTSGYAVEKTYKQSEINGTTVLANDRLFLTIDIPTPTIVDKLVGGSSVLTIVSAVAVQPGDTALIWKLQCRGI